MIRKKRFNLTRREKIARSARRSVLIQEKEKVFLDEPWTGDCDNKDHPRFTIKVDYNKKWAVCYYCSKMWLLK